MAMRRPCSRRLLRLRRCCSCRRRWASLCRRAAAEAADCRLQGLLALVLVLPVFTAQPSSESIQADRITSNASTRRLDFWDARGCVPLGQLLLHSMKNLS